MNIFDTQSSSTQMLAKFLSNFNGINFFLGNYQIWHALFWCNLDVFLSILGARSLSTQIKSLNTLLWVKTITFLQIMVNGRNSQ